jgi:hypothetical protein
MKKSRVFILITLGVFLCVSSLVRGEDLSVDFGSTPYTEGRIDAYFYFAGNISYDTMDAIRNGITARLILTFQLAESGGVFGSVKDILRERVESFNINYDVWENSYKISDRNRNEEYFVPNASDVLLRIHEIINPIALRANAVRNGDKLVVRAKIKIQTIKLFPPFGIFLFFFDPWNYESSWLYSEVFTIGTVR